MKARLALLSGLLLLPYPLAAQSACRQAPVTNVEHIQGFTVFTVPLPSRTRPFIAKALIPNSGAPAGAFVFSFSTLIGSQPLARVQMMPVAVELATKGRPTIVLQRELSWPEVAKSVGHLQADVLCAEQWLAAHTPIKSDDWMFVGPTADTPTFEQLHALGDNTSMSFYWGFPIAGLDEYKNTEDVLRDGVLRVAALTDFHD